MLIAYFFPFMSVAVPSCLLASRAGCPGAETQTEAKSAAELPPTPGRVPVAIHLGYAGEFDKKA